MEGVFVILAVFSVPLVAIVSSTWLRYKKMQLEAGEGSPDTGRRVRLLEQENADLRRRVETLETIATGGSLDAAEKLKALEAPKPR